MIFDLHLLRLSAIKTELFRVGAVEEWVGVLPGKDLPRMSSSSLNKQKAWVSAGSLEYRRVARDTQYG
jgi:hypothetical protein